MNSATFYPTGWDWAISSPSALSNFGPTGVTGALGQPPITPGVISTTKPAGLYPPDVRTEPTGTFAFPTMSAVYWGKGGPDNDGVNNGFFNVSDLPPSRGQFAVATSIVDVTGNTTSDQVDLGARGVEVELGFKEGLKGGCDLNLYMATPSGNVLAAAWTGLTLEDNGSLFCGHAEQVNLQGYPLVVEVLNITGSAKVSVFLTALS